MAGSARVDGGAARPRGPVTVLGATNPIAASVMPALLAAGTPVLAVARRPAVLPAGARFARVDFAADPLTDLWTVPPGDAVVSVLPLPLLAASLDRLRGARAVVAVGSTSVFAKADSDEAPDRAKAAELALAEAVLAAWGAHESVPWTVLRPTLVYDGVHDRNVARMIRLVRRARVLPVGRPASGLRQPIHVADVAAAILGALDAPRAANRAFNVAGGEVLTYRAMAERVFESQDLTPRLLALPVPWLRLAFDAAARLGLLRESAFGSAVFARMNQDLVFDAAEGLEVLGYAPRPFQPPRRGGPGHRGGPAAHREGRMPAGDGRADG